MTVNYPGPYEVRFIYQVNGREHQLRLSTEVIGSPQPGDDWTTITCTNHLGGTVYLTIEADAFIADLVKAYNSSDMTMLRAELWKYAPNSYDATWISSVTKTDPGTNANPTVPAGQLIYTFRTVGGNIMKVVLMETGFGSGASIQPPWTGSHADIQGEVSDDLGIWYARDGTRALLPLGIHPGINERLFKKLYR